MFWKLQRTDRLHKTCTFSMNIFKHTLRRQQVSFSMSVLKVLVSLKFSSNSSSTTNAVSWLTAQWIFATLSYLNTFVTKNISFSCFFLHPKYLSCTSYWCSSSHASYDSVLHISTVQVQSAAECSGVHVGLRRSFVLQCEHISDVFWCKCTHNFAA